MAMVRLPVPVRAEMIQHAHEEAPNECCGLLVGEGSLIAECVRAKNLHERPTTRYLLDPAEHIATIRRLRGTDSSVIGCYHSHPCSPPAPSETDFAEAYYPEFVWMIVSLAEPHFEEVAAFRLTSEGFIPISITVHLGR
jgi:proteasome lid subunit RPN8/RPN11